MLSISFNFDEKTQKVTNLKVQTYEKPVKTNIVNKYDLEVTDNKLSFTSEALEKLDAKAGDRLAINYWNESSTCTYPIISKAEVFPEGADGQKLSKSGTTTFRGQQRTTLLKFGSSFAFEEWKDRSGEIKDGVFKLVPIKTDDTDDVSISEDEKSLEEMKQSTLEDEIAEMLGEESSDGYDDLPF